jgi:hypothetical protein
VEGKASRVPSARRFLRGARPLACRLSQAASRREPRESLEAWMAEVFEFFLAGAQASHGIGPIGGGMVLLPERFADRPTASPWGGP